MPVEKVPVVHKFGIISQKQRLELQERLLKLSYQQSVASRPHTQSRNPIEVTEDFVQQYNTTENQHDRDKLDGLVAKMLLRIKRRARLKDGGVGLHVDLPVAWTELSQLAQCKGKIQEDCLDVLITSLDQAPLDRVHIPALFFLAETTLYWLRTDAVHQPYLRTGEIKLLHMGQLVFNRLFYHHMAGQLQGHGDFKTRLHTYLDGFTDCQDAYSPYPNALFCLRYMAHVGKVIMADVDVMCGEVKEGDIRSTPRVSSQAHHADRSPRSGAPGSAGSASLSGSVHDLSPSLWHGLDVWRCVHHLGGGLGRALTSLGHCGTSLASGSWIDGVCALSVLADAARANVKVMRAMQNLARGVTVAPPCGSESVSPSPALLSSSNEDHSTRVIADDHLAISRQIQQSQMTSHGNLSDIYERSEPGSDSRSRPAPKHLQHNSLRDRQEQLPADSRSYGPHSGSVPEASRRPEQMREAPGSRPQGSARTAVSTGTQLTDTETACRVEVGSELGPEGRASQASSAVTYGNAEHPDLPGIHGWRWEVAITYADHLADICLHGNTSEIQKMALVGCNGDVAGPHRVGMTTSCPMSSAGLLDLVYFTAAAETDDGGADDWSWRVRYSALQGLVRICRCCSGDTAKEGMRTVAWNTLIRANSLERDIRVLEALKVGQVNANIEKLISDHLSVELSTIGAKVAAGLSTLYLPPLPPAVTQPSPRRLKNHAVARAKPPVPVPGVERRPLRTSLREEILLATAFDEPTPTFETRTTFDLKRIVEDQWRKDVQQQLDDEEEERQRLLAEKQKEEEEKQMRAVRLRREKLPGKYGKDTGTAPWLDIKPSSGRQGRVAVPGVIT